MKTFMQIDVEALARTANAVILSIGACTYDMDGIKSSIELFPSVAPQVALGREIDDETLMWWLGQNDEARKNIIRGERQAIHLIADEFVDWAHDQRAFVVGGKENLWFSAYGNDFDLPMVSTLLEKHRTMPWEGRPNYKNKMCLRAVAELYKNHIEWPEGPTAHTARADAINQAKAHISLLQKFPEMR
jgi:hypothetical protein